MREIEQRTNERRIVLGSSEVLDEGAIDLDDVDAELAQIVEGSVAGAEIVDRHAAAEIPRSADETACLVDILDFGRFRDLKREPAGAGLMGLQVRPKTCPPIRVDHRLGRNIEAETELWM